MASQRPEPVASRGLAMVIAWTLFVVAWLVLVPLGRATTGLWFAGLGPVAAWLAVAGAANAVTGTRGPSKAAVAMAGLLAAASLPIAVRTGNGGALFAAALGWGVVSCAASRRTGSAFAPGCFLPAQAPGDPASWAAFGARWTMLPMMAALGVQSDWCASIGVSPMQGVALHLAAMLVPAAWVRASPWRRSLGSPPCIAAFMAAGMAALPLLPGVRGWMAMSLLHAVAGGFAWSRGAVVTRAHATHRRAIAGGSAWRALSPAVGLLAVGSTIDAFGLDGLVTIHVALGALSVAGAMAWLVVDAWHHADPEQEETLS